MWWIAATDHGGGHGMKDDRRVSMHYYLLVCEMVALRELRAGMLAMRSSIGKAKEGCCQDSSDVADTLETSWDLKVREGKIGR
jgi:hypothetical protein